MLSHDHLLFPVLLRQPRHRDRFPTSVRTMVDGLSEGFDVARWMACAEDVLT